MARAQHSAELLAALQKLITANHILHYNGVLDAFGHISMRSPDDSDTFWISKDSAPALVSSPEDIEEYRVSDASAVRKNAPKGYLERFIHSEIYKIYSDVHAVIHSHNDSVLPFSITSVPLRPVYHMGGSMGYDVPVFDVAQHYREQDSMHSLLINKEHLGAALAANFTPSGTASSDSTSWPPCMTVLMRGHGFTCVGQNIEDAVFRAIYTCNNARLQTAALTLQTSYNVGLAMNAATGRGNIQYLKEHRSPVEAMVQGSGRVSSV